MASDVLGKLKESILGLDMDAAVDTAHSIAGGDRAVSAEAGIDAVSEALEVVGKRFQKGEWFVADLVYAGEITKAALGVLAPMVTAGTPQRLGTVVVGTVAGDLHDLGKNIFVTYAQAAGFDVIDLGADVPVETFADAVSEHRPLALGLSCLLTVTAAEVAKVIGELSARGTREGVKVIVGGAALTEDFATSTGADAFAPDAVTGTDIIKGWSSS